VGDLYYHFAALVFSNLAPTERVVPRTRRTSGWVSQPRTISTSGSAVTKPHRARTQLGRLLREARKTEPVAVVPHRLADARPIAAASAVDQLCAGQLGGESPLPNLMEVKG